MNDDKGIMVSVLKMQSMLKSFLHVKTQILNDILRPNHYLQDSQSWWWDREWMDCYSAMVQLQKE